MTITKRLTKGSALTHAELDDNFDYLDANKANKDLSNVLNLPDAVKELLRGPKGDKGDQGVAGVGTNGTNGATWRSGIDAPASSLGANGDYYLNTTTHDVSLKSSNTYSVICNIKGANGVNGVDGSNGSAGLSASQNLLINSGFTINQCLHTSGSALGVSAYGHDMWKAGLGNCTYTFTQGALGVPIQVTIASGSLIQIVEGVYIPKDGTYVLSWQGTAQARVNYGAYSSSPLVVNELTAGVNVSIEFNTGTVFKPQFESGLTASEYSYQAYDQELTRSMRYFQRLSNSLNTSNTAIGIGRVISTSNANFYIKFPVRMRSSPTVSYSGLTMQPGSSVSSIVTYGVGLDSTYIQVIATSSMTVGDAAILFSSSTSAYLDINARL